MRNVNTRSRTIKRKIEKCKTIFYAHSELQNKYADVLVKDESVKEIKANVKLTGCSLGDNYTSDFVLTLEDGTTAVREVVKRDKLLKPMTLSQLSASRSYWASKGIKDWGIVTNA